jgi:triosephosphate isomerase
MPQPQRPLFIAGNWKMNPPTVQRAMELAEGVKRGVGLSCPVRVAVCPPAVFLADVDRVLEGSPIGLGAQNMYFEPSGAYTGELSGLMLNNIGCTHVILGHSERRQILGETDALIARKVRAALDARLIPILCVGETLEQREADQTESVVQAQLEGSLAEASQLNEVVLAYEPVWAIGTGRTATPEQAQEVHAFIRRRLAQRYGEPVAQNVTILYGGSMTPDKAPDLLARPDIDGGLVGGASLKAEDFLGIIQAGVALAGA